MNIMDDMNIIDKKYKNVLVILLIFLPINMVFIILNNEAKFTNLKGLWLY